MANGYIPVSGNVTNGIMTMEASGNTPVDGGEYWLLWNENGYTGMSWYFGQGNEPVSIWWCENVNKINTENSTEFTNDERGFKDYMSSAFAPENLNHVLGNWPNLSKLNFMMNIEDFKYDNTSGTFGSSCISSISN